MVTLSEIVETIPHSPTLWANDIVHEKRSAGEAVFHMGFGESPFPVAPRLCEALGREGHRKEYLKAEGLPELVAAVKEYYRPIYGDDYIDNSDVIVAPGSKMILYALQMAIAGDLVMPEPSWVSYEPQARMLYQNAVKVPADLSEDGYQIDPQALRAAVRDARAAGKNPSKFILNVPNNPTGLTMPEDNLRAIAKVCEEEGLFIISDEIYGLVSFDHQYRTCAAFAPQITAVSTGLSKHLSLGGWRIGVGIIPRSATGLYHALRCIVSETWSCVSAPVQAAAVEAYKGYADIEKHIADCTAIHELMNQAISRGLQDMGVKAPTAQGAFYNYPNFAPYREALAKNGVVTSQDLHEVLLNEYNLATLPGHAFGAPELDLTLRLSGCDYDGAAALRAYQNGAALDQDFVKKYAPNIMSALGQFKAFLQDKAGL